jgi:hypothetical protein
MQPNREILKQTKEYGTMDFGVLCQHEWSWQEHKKAKVMCCPGKFMYSSEQHFIPSFSSVLTPFPKTLEG